MMKKEKMDTSMVMMSVRSGCTEVPVNKTIAVIRQPCGETEASAAAKSSPCSRAPLEPSGARSSLPLSSAPPGDPRPTYQA